ncbi:hypothetical protein VTN31DRAFT_3848 [Thermomyces dupontii]|uniref:uncharacterized protein n=1 Tax=Talaromyces thermophilus TaxID=28565 RepID=UPI0037424EB7
MWWYRIHAPLELMRSRLPDSLEHMIMFIHATYSMLTLFVENVPSLEATWLECLGDLARYGMVVQEKTPQNREIWRKVSRSWYMQAADRNPGVGRLQHHLAVLSQPNILQQLFYYSKSLVSVEPFTNARSSIHVVLFRPLLRPEGPPQIEHFPALLIRFVTAHGVLFTRGMLSTFLANARFFLQNLDSFIGQVGAHFREQGAQISLISIAAIFDFGQPDARIPKLFDGETTQALSPSGPVTPDVDPDDLEHLSRSEGAARAAGLARRGKSNAARKNRHALIAFGEAKNATSAFALIGKVDLKEGSPIQEPRHRLQRLGVYCQS